MANCLTQLQKIDVEDLPYLERDLSFAQKISLAFLLFGDQRSNAIYILQKLLALANADDNTPQRQHTDLLRQYVNTNPNHWRSYLIEALTIIDARRVLRKLGFNWEELRLHYLPHICEVTLHLHPLLKALYLICEQVTEAQTGRLVLSINTAVYGNNEHLRFYDFAYLEIFLLDWITRHFIKLGDLNAEGSNVQPLIEYFKFNDLDSLATILINTVNSNATVTTATNPTEPTTPQNVKYELDNASASEPAIATRPLNNNIVSASVRHQDVFEVSRENAGIVLIINQQYFHRNVSEDCKALLPKFKLKTRDGTDVDKQRLSQVFSKFGYTVEIKDNLDHLEMLSCIRDVCARSMLRDSLIVCILSHGFEGAVYCHDSIALQISDIENVLCANEDLRSKPKMLIVQACQQKDNQMETRNVNAKTKSPEQHLNILKAISTVAGFVALRDTSKGSWFIQSLCDAIEEHAASKHMVDILTNAIRLVSVKRGDKNQVMVPQVNFTLTRYFYLPRNEVTD